MEADAKSFNLMWDEVSSVASSAFDVRREYSEVVWAETAWNKLAEQGLTSYNNEFDRCKVAIRFIALADLYHDWCSIVDEDDIDLLDHSYLADKLEINAFRLGQLIGASKSLESVDEVSELIEIAIAHLVDVERTALAKTLVTVFGTKSALFLSLWRINNPAPEPEIEVQKQEVPNGQLVLFSVDESDIDDEADEDDEDDEDEDEGDDEDGLETDYEVLNYLSTPKILGFEWISDRMPISR